MLSPYEITLAINNQTIFKRHLCGYGFSITYSAFPEQGLCNARSLHSTEKHPADRLLGSIYCRYFSVSLLTWWELQT